MKNKYIIGLFSIACILSSCKIGKKYTRPELNLPDKIIATQTDSLTIADESWWTIYSDTILQNLIKRALEYNKDMLTAASRIKEMAERKKISFSKLFPELGINIHGERETFNLGKDNAKNDDTFEAKGILSWELDLWGNLRWSRVADIAEYLESVEARINCFRTGASDCRPDSRSPKRGCAISKIEIQWRPDI